MPIVQITLVRGRDEEKIEACVRRVATTVADALDAPLQTVRVIVNEVEPNHFAVGDTLKSDGRDTQSNSKPGS